MEFCQSEKVETLNALLHEIVTAVPVTVLYKALFRAEKHLQTFVSKGRKSITGSHFSYTFCL